MASQLLLILLLVCGPWLSGCAAPVIIAAGAGTGYVMADDKSRRKVDRFFKDISRSVKQTTRRLTREQPRKKTTAPGKQGRFALRINKTGLHPARVPTQGARSSSPCSTRSMAGRRAAVRSRLSAGCSRTGRS
ncbi:MAG: hypothetical protein RBT36_11580 [Desulfobulbus sp.]|nr:hypothetical protein [Desulfobulbus sp.]